jgi:pimeloyl-ACP methyl ester carboxylesterase
MKRIFIAIWWSLALALAFQGAGLASRCEPDGVQASGSIYRICMPDPQPYNDRLVIWAHGFQTAGEPVSIPEDQLRTKNFSIQEFVNDLGFGFATNSYSKTGLAVRQGMADILDLVDLYSAAHGAPERIYLIGASEGGLITALLVEQHPDIFTGGLAACGPVGNFAYQIRYIGDARATFDYFFPGLIPDQGDPFHPSPELIASWDQLYTDQIGPDILAPDNRRNLNQWGRVARLIYDPARPRITKEESARGLLGYAVLNLNDAAATLGGFPFGNLSRRYSGSANDADLNARVPRIAADPAALQEMQAHYTTSGQLKVPLVTLHSTRDSLVPYQHERLYIAKTRRAGDFRRRHFNIKTSSYGHCQFTQGEVLLAVATLGASTGEASFVGNVATNTLDPVLRRELRKLARLNNLKIDLSDGNVRIRLPGGLRF